MKRNKKVQLKRGAAAILIGGILLCPSPIVHATNIISISSSNSESVKASKGLNLYLDDRVFAPTDVNGNIVDVYAIDGTTYLPARAIAEATGASISWDGLTNTVTINTKANNEKKNNTPFVEPCKPENVNITINKNIKLVIDGQTIIPVNANGEPVDVFAVNGTTYLPLRYILSVLEIPIEWEGYSNSVFMGKHMEQDNPYNYDNEYQRRAQSILNYTEIILNQCYTDGIILEEQFIKLTNIMDKIDAVILSEGYESACYKELKPIQDKLFRLYDLGVINMNLFYYSYTVDVTSEVINMDLYNQCYYINLENSKDELETKIETVQTETDLDSFRSLKAEAKIVGEAGQRVRNEFADTILNEYLIQVDAIISKYGKVLNYNNF